MTANVITVANRKGGDGKTVTAFNLAKMYHADGKRVLMVDMDSQYNLSIMNGSGTADPSIYDVLIGSVQIREAVRTITAGLDAVSGSEMISICDRLFTDLDAPYRLKEALEAVINEYDNIIIDTSPSLGICTVMALTASNSVIIPAQCDKESLQGIAMIVETVHKVQKRTNNTLNISGILLTRYNGRSIYTKQLEQSIRQFTNRNGLHVFRDPIRESISVKESAFLHKSISEYNSKSTASQDFQKFFSELKELQER